MSRWIEINFIAAESEYSMLINCNDIAIIDFKLNIDKSLKSMAGAPFIAAEIDIFSMSQKITVLDFLDVENARLALQTLKAAMFNKLSTEAVTIENYRITSYHQQSRKYV